MPIYIHTSQECQGNFTQLFWITTEICPYRYFLGISRKFSPAVLDNQGNMPIYFPRISRKFPPAVLYTLYSGQPRNFSKAVRTTPMILFTYGVEWMFIEIQFLRISVEVQVLHKCFSFSNCKKLSEIFPYLYLEICSINSFLSTVGT